MIQTQGTESSLVGSKWLPSGTMVSLVKFKLVPVHKNRHPPSSFSPCRTFSSKTEVFINQMTECLNVWHSYSQASIWPPGMYKWVFLSPLCKKPWCTPMILLDSTARLKRNRRLCRSASSATSVARSVWTSNRVRSAKCCASVEAKKIEDDSQDCEAVLRSAMNWSVQIIRPRKTLSAGVSRFRMLCTMHWLLNDSVLLRRTRLLSCCVLRRAEAHTIRAFRSSNASSPCKSFNVSLWLTPSEPEATRFISCTKCPVGKAIPPKDVWSLRGMKALTCPYLFRWN